MSKHLTVALILMNVPFKCNYMQNVKSLGTINILLHKFKKAKVCFEESVDLYYKIAKEQPTESAVIELIDAYARIGGLFEKAGDISTAKDFYKRSIHMATIFANKVDI